MRKAADTFCMQVKEELASGVNPGGEEVPVKTSQIANESVIAAILVGNSPVITPLTPFLAPSPAPSPVAIQTTTPDPSPNPTPAPTAASPDPDMGSALNQSQNPAPIPATFAPSLAPSVGTVAGSVAAVSTGTSNITKKAQELVKSIASSRCQSEIIASVTRMCAADVDKNSLLHSEAIAKLVELGTIYRQDAPTCAAVLQAIGFVGYGSNSRSQQLFENAVVPVILDSFKLHSADRTVCHQGCVALQYIADGANNLRSDALIAAGAVPLLIAIASTFDIPNATFTLQRLGFRQDGSRLSESPVASTASVCCLAYLS